MLLLIQKANWYAAPNRNGVTSKKRVPKKKEKSNDDSKQMHCLQYIAPLTKVLISPKRFFTACRGSRSLLFEIYCECFRHQDRVHQTEIAHDLQVCQNSLRPYSCLEREKNILSPQMWSLCGRTKR